MTVVTEEGKEHDKERMVRQDIRYEDNVCKG